MLLGIVFSVIAGMAMSMQGVMNTRLGEGIGNMEANAFVQGTAYCFIMQVISQQHVSATAAGVTLSLEPVFSALFAYVTLGERLGLGQFAGAALMLGGVLWISTRER